MTPLSFVFGGLGLIDIYDELRAVRGTDVYFPLWTACLEFISNELPIHNVCLRCVLREIKIDTGDHPANLKQIGPAPLCQSCVKNVSPTVPAVLKEVLSWPLFFMIQVSKWTLIALESLDKLGDNDVVAEENVTLAGHSMGVFAAGFASATLRLLRQKNNRGVFDRSIALLATDFLSYIVRIVRAIVLGVQKLDQGPFGMVSISGLPIESVDSLIAQWLPQRTIEIVVKNGHDRCVVAGPTIELDYIRRKLGKQSSKFRPLKIVPLAVRTPYHHSVLQLVSIESITAARRHSFDVEGRLLIGSTLNGEPRVQGEGERCSMATLASFAIFRPVNWLNISNQLFLKKAGVSVKIIDVGPGHPFGISVTFGSKPEKARVAWNTRGYNLFSYIAMRSKTTTSFLSLLSRPEDQSATRSNKNLDGDLDVRQLIESVLIKNGIGWSEESNGVFYAFSSLSALKAAKEILESLQLQKRQAVPQNFSLPDTLLFQHPSLDSLVFAIKLALKIIQPEHILVGNARNLNHHRLCDAGPHSGRSVQVRGLSCCFHGADDSFEFWNLLRSADSVNLGFHRSGRHRGGTINGVSFFDNAFFGLNRSEANALDPQQRVLLHHVYQAIEMSKVSMKQLRDLRVGVFVGSFVSDSQLLGMPGPRVFHGPGTSESALAGRIAHVFNFCGPCLTVNTACSSGLLAVHLARQSLLLEECDVAIVAAANLIFDAKLSDSFQDAGMLSPEGRCQTFSREASGYVRSEGIAALVLSGNRSSTQFFKGPVLADVVGSASVSDGHTPSFTAPSVNSQIDSMVTAIYSSNLQPSDVTFVECHGTGTKLGDQLELQALHSVFSGYATVDQPCREVSIGSAKRVIGHTEAVAGLAGLIKAVLSLNYRMFPGIPADVSETSLLTVPQPLSISRNHSFLDKQTAVGIVSSFGFTGTNVNVVLSQTSPFPSSVKSDCHRSSPLGTTTDTTYPEVLFPCVFPISSHALHLLPVNSKKWGDRLRAAVEHHRQSSKVGTGHLLLHAIVQAFAQSSVSSKHRAFVIASSYEDLLEKLDCFDGKNTLSPTYRDDNFTLLFDEGRNGSRRGKRPPVAFQFTGQGAYRSRIGHRLHARFAVFRDALDYCLDLFEKEFPSASVHDVYWNSEPNDGWLPQLHQPILFSFEWALAQLWLSFGVCPDVVCGHSFGEYVAVCLAGLISLADAVRLISVRSKLMAELTGGQMYAIKAPASKLQPLIDEIVAQVDERAFTNNAMVSFSGRDAVVVAAVNSESQTVISGPNVQCAYVAGQLASRFQLKVKKLSVTAAFHSPWMLDIESEFREALARVQWQPVTGGIWIVSNVTGALIAPENAMSVMGNADYWVRHLCSPVQYAPGAVTICDLTKHSPVTGSFVIEIGAAPVLSHLYQDCCCCGNCVVVPSASSINENEDESWLRAAADLWSISPSVDAGLGYQFDLLCNNGPGTFTTEDLGHCHPHLSNFWPSSSFDFDEMTHVPTISLSPRLIQCGTKTVSVPSQQAIDTVDEIFEVNELCESSLSLSDYFPEITVRKQVKRAKIDLFVSGRLEESATNVILKLRQRFLDIDRLTTNTLVVLLHNRDQTPVDQTSNCFSDLVAGAVQGFLRSAILELSNCRILSLRAPSDLSVSQLNSAVSYFHSNFHSSRSMCELILDCDRNHKDGWSTPSFEWARDVFPCASSAPRPPPTAGTQYTLITGGLGGIGAVIAEMLLSFGLAQNILLLGRRQLSPSNRNMLRRWERSYSRTSVVYRQVDVGARSQVESLMSSNEFLIDSVVHCAGVSWSGNLADVDETSFNSVFEGKVLGAFHLHEWSLKKATDLSFFVCLSSVLAPLGGKRASCYTSANEALGALARFRNRQGLPATTVHLGAVDGVGMAHRGGMSLRHILESQGIGYSSVYCHAFNVISLIRHSKQGEFVSSELDIAKCEASRPYMKRALQRLSSDCNQINAFDTTSEPVPNANHKASLFINETEDEELSNPPSIVQIQKKLCRIFEWASWSKDLENSTFESLGVNSLTAFSIRQQLQKHFPTIIRLPDTWFVDWRSPRSLVRHLATLMVIHEAFIKLNIVSRADTTEYSSNTQLSQFGLNSLLFPSLAEQFNSARKERRLLTSECPEITTKLLVSQRTLGDLTSILENNFFTNLQTRPDFMSASKVSSVVERLKAVGLRAGDTVLVSSSFTTAVAEFCGSPQVILDALIDLVLVSKDSPQGTLLFPTYNWEFCSGKPWSATTSKNMTGLLSEYALCMPESNRTTHPIYSFAVIGHLKDYFCSQSSCSGRDCFGERGPFAALVRNNAKFVVVDTDYNNSMTIFHHAEQLKRAIIDYRFLKTFRGNVTDQHGNETENFDCTMFVRNLDMKFSTDVGKWCQTLEEQNVILVGSLGEAKLRAGRLSQIVDLTMQQLVKNNHLLISMVE